MEGKMSITGSFNQNKIDVVYTFFSCLPAETLLWLLLH